MCLILVMMVKKQRKKQRKIGELTDGCQHHPTPEAPRV